MAALGDISRAAFREAACILENANLLQEHFEVRKQYI
jgi:hypothetical protein